MKYSTQLIYISLTSVNYHLEGRRKHFDQFQEQLKAKLKGLRLHILNHDSGLNTMAHPELNAKEVPTTFLIKAS